MSDVSTNRDLVHIEETFHSVYKELVEGTIIAEAPFRTMKDVFMWAMSIGIQSGKRRSFSGKRVSIFRWAPFTTQIDIPLLKAIAIIETGEIGVISNQDMLLTIAEEFANYGIHTLRQILFEEKGQPLWNLITLLPLPSEKDKFY